MGPDAPTEEADEAGAATAAGTDPVTEAATPQPLPVYDDLLEFPEPGPGDLATGTEAYPAQGAWPAVPAPFHQPSAYPQVEEPEPRGRNRAVIAVVGGRRGGGRGRGGRAWARCC